MSLSHRSRVVSFATLVAAVALPTLAHAHFALRAPACYSVQDALGSPQKSGPCGQADPGNTAVETGAVTAYLTGSSITLTIDETIFHPGHYRIAIAQDMASLPADPPVTAGSTACGSTTIDANPTLPVLADGVFVHTAAFSGPQTMQIPLPAGFTCDHCVLQVIEFMSNHGLNNPGGCFYHHCAMVTVGESVDAGGTDASTPDDVTTADASVDASVDAAQTDANTGTDAANHDAAGDLGAEHEPTDAGCHCRATPGTRPRMPLAWTAILTVGLFATRRRRERRV